MTNGRDGWMLEALFLGSMEGAVLSGKLAAEVVADKSAGRTSQLVKEVVELYR